MLLGVCTKKEARERKLCSTNVRFFFDTKPEATPKKDGENPLVPQRRFRALSSESIEIRFTNNTVTQFGGYPLWDQFCREIGLN